MTRLSILFIGTLVATSIGVAGCERKQSEPISSEEVGRKIEEASTTATEYTKQQKEEYVAKVQREISDLKTGLDGLQRRAEIAKADTKARLDKDLRALNRGREQAEQKLEKLKAASMEKWWDMKAGVDKAVEDLRQAFARTDKNSS